MCRILGHVEVQNTSPVVRNDKEAIENAEGERRHGEEIHCGNGLAVITQKGRPWLCRLRIPGSLPHPTQDGSFRNIVAEHFQLAVDSRCSPSRVLGYQAEYELPQLSAYTCSSRLLAMSG